MKTILCACLLVTALPAGISTVAAQTPAKPKVAARTITLTGNDQMKFDKTTIAAKPGETIRIVLKSAGTMPKTVMGHNFVLLKLGTDVAAFSTAAFNARATIANTKLAGPGESVEVTFKVPAKAGSYDYLCSFPGHSAVGMRGKLIVK